MDSTLPSISLGTVLVTGGCGFLGSHVVSALLSLPVPPTVHVLSRTPTTNLHPSAIYHAGDINSPSTVSSLIALISPSAIIHTASPRYTSAPSILHATNVVGTQNLIRLATESPSVQAFVHTSSESAVVPDYDHGSLTEDKAVLYTEKSKVNAYAKTKALADSMVLAANSEALKTAVIRLPGIYGECDHYYIPSLLNQIRKGQHRVQIGPDTKNFEFVYAGSAASAHVLAVQALLSSTPSSELKVAGEAFFVSDNSPHPFFAFARKIYRLAGHPVRDDEIKVMSYNMVLALAIAGEWVYRVFTAGTKVPEVRSAGIRYFDRGSEWNIGKAKERLGYKPILDQEEALRKSVEWALEKEKEKGGEGKEA